MHIQEDDPRSPDVSKLLNEHLDAMRSISEPESKHALDISGLCASTITLWTLRQSGELLGCGALSELERFHGEIKSMRTAQGHLRKGVGSKLLEQIIQVAQDRGYTRLSLETGAQVEFAPARSMYARFGFEVCDAFGSYQPDPKSVFMTLEL